MAKQTFNADDVASVLRAANLLDESQLYAANANAPNDLQVVPITLTYATAKSSGDPFQINFPFRSVYVMKSTHPALVLQMRPYTRDEGQGIVELTEKDIVDFGTKIPRAYLFWDAQSVSGGSNIVQKVTLLFSLTAQFKSGSLSTVKGGVKTDVYNNFTCAKSNVTSGVATLLTSPGGLGALGQNQSWLIQNLCPDTLYVGSSSATAADFGYAVAPGDSFKWNNLTDLYGFSTAGGPVMILREF